MSALLNQYGIRNFTWHEITKGQEDIPGNLIMNIFPTLVVLQAVRDFVHTPISINSSYRSKEYNKKVGGSKNSLHMQFSAIDFSVKGYNSNDYKYLYNLICRGDFSREVEWKNVKYKIEPKKMGIGLYQTFIHIDTRGLLGIRGAKW